MSSITRKDWLSRNKQELQENANATWIYLNKNGNRARFGFGPVTSGTLPAPPPDFEREDVTPGLLSGNLSQSDWLDNTYKLAFDTFNAAYTAWLNPAERTKIKILNLKDAEKVFIPLYRKLYGSIKGNPLVTSADLAEMKFPVPQGTRTPAQVPTTFPEVTISHPALDVVRISFRDAGNANRRKPAGVHGAEIIWSILDTPPQDDEWSLLTHSEFDTASPFTLTFNNAEQGKSLYFALRWENTRGEKGPWSRIQHTVIS